MSVTRIVPSQVRLSEWAEACGVTIKVVRKRAVSRGIIDIVRPLGAKRSGVAVVGDSRLRETWPDDYERVYAWFLKNPNGHRGRRRSASPRRASDAPPGP